MYDLSIAVPQSFKTTCRKTESKAKPKDEQKTAQKVVKKVAKKTKTQPERVFKEEVASVATWRAVEKGMAEIARGEFFTLEDLEAKYLK